MDEGKPKRKTGRLATQATRHEALKLRLSGCDYATIAERLGYASKGAAYNAVELALAETAQEPADSLRKIEAERLDRMTEALWPAMAQGDPAIVDRILKIMERRAKMLGLDAAEKVSVQGDIGEVMARRADELLKAIDQGTTPPAG